MITQRLGAEEGDTPVEQQHPDLVIEIVAIAALPD
jgi:hypothetical protein